MHRIYQIRAAKPKTWYQVSLDTGQDESIWRLWGPNTCVPITLFQIKFILAANLRSSEWPSGSLKNVDRTSQKNAVVAPPWSPFNSSSDDMIRLLINCHSSHGISDYFSLIIPNYPEFNLYE